MIGKIYKTRYSSIVPKGVVGQCIDEVNKNGVYALLIQFNPNEKFWFLYRDLKECE